MTHARGRGQHLLASSQTRSVTLLPVLWCKDEKAPISGHFFLPKWGCSIHSTIEPVGYVDIEYHSYNASSLVQSYELIYICGCPSLATSVSGLALASLRHVPALYNNGTQNWQHPVCIIPRPCIIDRAQRKIDRARTHAPFSLRLEPHLLPNRTDY